MKTWIDRLPMVLALEADYDTHEYWYQGKFHAEVVSEQEVQPLFTMKDTWDLCICEGAREAAGEEFGQIDPLYGEPIREFIWCPLSVSQYRYDWRPGRELTEEQASSWAQRHKTADAHHLFNGPRKEGTPSVHLPAANGIRPQQLAWVDDVTGDGVRVEYAPDDAFDGGFIRVSDGSNHLSVPVAESGLEDGDFIEVVVRATVERFEQRRRERERSRREGGSADSGGPAAEGAAE